MQDLDFRVRDLGFRIWILKVLKGLAQDVFPKVLCLSGG